MKDNSYAIPDTSSTTLIMHYATLKEVMIGKGAKQTCYNYTTLKSKARLTFTLWVKVLTAIQK